MLIFQSRLKQSSSRKYADQYIKKEEEAEARRAQQEAIQRQMRMAELVKSPGNVIAQTELARLQLKTNPYDLGTPVRTIQNCLKLNRGSMDEYLLALDSIFELVVKTEMRNRLEKTQTSLKPALDAIRALTDKMQLCQPTKPEANSALYQLAYISSRFYDSTPAGKNRGEREWLLMDVQMEDGWGSLEDFYHNHIQPTAGTKAFEQLAEQNSLQGKMEFLQTAFRVLNEYKGWEKMQGDEEVGYAAYRTPSYFKKYADDPFLQFLLEKVDETLRSLGSAQIRPENVKETEAAYHALVSEMEKFNGRQFEGGGAYAGTSANNKPANFMQFVVSKLGAGNVEELFVFRVKDACLGTLKTARAEKESR